MPDQLTFDLPFRPAMGREDFFVSTSNAVALALIDAVQDWPSGRMVLVGDAGAGKTHLAQVWATRLDARFVADLEADDPVSLAQAPGLVLEDVDRPMGLVPQEEALFHLLNAAAHKGTPVLLTARQAPSRWPVRLPDLASRLAQAGVAKLEPPDDALLLAVMLKRATDRKLTLTPEMLAYLAPRLPRSFAAADAVIARIDARALSQKRRPNQAHVRAALADVTGDPAS